MYKDRYVLYILSNATIMSGIDIYGVYAGKDQYLHMLY